MRILVCGGRHFVDINFLYAELDKRIDDFSLVISGAQSGADDLAIMWARARELPFFGVPARWSDLGRGAGMERNKRMFDLTGPEKIIAFPGNQGTRNMCAIGKQAGVPVEFIGW